MIIIADSGSTKTQWALIYDNKVETITTIGLNPYHVSSLEIARVASEEVASRTDEKIEAIHFYGSGITPQKQSMMQLALAEAFGGKDIEIHAESDMLGAARALFGNQQGIACILGTGANSCYYDGSQIAANTPALGYILGDEGGGASIGKHLVNALYKNKSLDTLRALFEKEYGLTQADIIERVYRQPMANRFLASLAPFAKKFSDVMLIKYVVLDDFTNFFVRNLRPYPSGLPVSFVGSIAHHFEPLLRTAAKETGFKIASIVQSPIEGLIKYHKK